MNTNSIPSLLLAAALAVGGVAALPSAAHAGAYVSVRVGPPAPLVEVVPAARPGYVWAPGHHEWRQGRYVWVRGYWVRERAGYAYAPAAWAQQGSQWVYQPARWNRRAHPMGDRDHDGVRNRWDRDRDGDGLRNGPDRHPNNGRRY